MNNLIKYEFIKIIKTKRVLIATMILLVTVSLNIFNVSNEYFGEFSGIAAVKHQFNAQKNNSGPITGDKLKKITTYYHDIVYSPKNLNDPKDKTSGLTDEAFVKFSGKYSNFESLIIRATTPKGESTLNKSIVDISPDESSKIYDMRNINVEKYLNNSKVSSSTKEYLINKISMMEKPLNYKPIRGWEQIIRTIDDASGMFIMIVIAICLAPIFTNEYQTGVDNLILSSKKGRRELAISKFIAAFIFTTLFFLIFMTYIIICNLILYGPTGANTPIQALSYLWYSMYNMTFLQATLMIIGLSYLATLFYVSIIMIISVKSKKSFTSIILCLLLIFIPYFIYATNSINDFSIISKLMFLFPSNMTLGLKIISSYIVFNFLNFVVPLPVIICIVSIIGILILLLMTMRSFYKHQVS